MSITTWKRQQAISRPTVRAKAKDVSGRIVKNESYAEISSALSDTATNRQTYPGSFDYTSFSSDSDTGDRFGNVEQYFNTIFETGSWFRNTGSETS